jgi:hypothetical protein
VPEAEDVKKDEAEKAAPEEDNEEDKASKDT